MRARTRHKLRNLLHSALLIVGMALVVSVCAWTLWGSEGFLWTLAIAAILVALSPSVPPALVLALYHARPLGRSEIPQVYATLQALSRQAGLATAPRLYYLPSSVPNAFAVGSRDDAAIAMTDGMLRTLSFRELANVLAHEISHIASGDLWIMTLADAMSRVTSIMSYLGMFLLVLNLPLIVAGKVVVPWLLVLLLLLAPSAMSLLQLALSRAREFDADLGAASLTDDPRGLASALAKLEQRDGRFWEHVVFPGWRVPDPSLLRTHPATEERIRRLIDLDERSPAHAPLRPTRRRIVVPGHIAPVVRPARYRWSGLWY